MKKKLIITITITIFLFLGVVYAKNAYSCLLPNEAMGVQSVIARKEIDTLFIGSSAYRKGIDMPKMQADLGNAFMLTYNGNEPMNIEIELEQILQAGTRIKRLVVDFNPSMADRGADLSDKRLLWDVDLSAKIKLWKYIVQEETTSAFTFYDFWVLSNNDYMATYPISYPLIASRYELGGAVASEDREGSTPEELNQLPVVENPGIHPLQLAAIGNIEDMCRDNGIELIWLEAPRYITMEEDINYQDKKNQLTDYIGEKGGKVILSEDMEFDNANSEYFADLTHMSAKGKEVFSKKIIENLLSTQISE